MSIVVRVWKCRSVRQSTRSSKWREEARDVVDVERRLVFPGDDQQVLGQRELPLAEQGVGGGQDFLGASHGRVGDVALAGDGQKQGVNAGGVDGVDRVDAGKHARDDRPGQLVDQGAERRVFLGRPSHRGKRPDGPFAVVDAFDLQHGKVVLEAVIAEVVSERPLGLADVGIDRAADDEIGLGRHGEAPVGRDHGDTSASQGAGERQLGQPLGQGHDGGDRQGGRAADEDVDPQRLTPADRRRVVHADPAVDLVMQADLAVRLILVARELDPVHPQVRPSRPGRSGSSV